MYEGSNGKRWGESTVRRLLILMMSDDDRSRDYTFNYTFILFYSNCPTWKSCSTYPYLSTFEPIIHNTTIAITFEFELRNTIIFYGELLFLLLYLIQAIINLDMIWFKCVCFSSAHKSTQIHNYLTKKKKPIINMYNLWFTLQTVMET